jgi:hypothetical protein
MVFELFLIYNSVAKMYKRLCLPDDIQTQIDLCAPDHAVKIAPVLRAIRAPRKSVMPHNSLMHKRAISFGAFSESALFTDEFVQACIEGIEANGSFNDIHLKGRVDMRIVESAFTNPKLVNLNYHMYLYMPTEYRERLCSSFATLEGLVKLQVFVESSSIQQLDWDDVVSKVLMKSPSLQELSLYLDVSYSSIRFPKIQDAINNHSNLVSLKVQLNNLIMFDFHTDLSSLSLHQVHAPNLIDFVRLGKCDKLSYLSIRCVLFDMSKRVTELISEIAAMIERSKCIGIIKLRDGFMRRYVKKDDGCKLADAIRVSTSLRLVQLCTSMFTDDAIDLIRAACEASGRVDLDLHND